MAPSIYELFKGFNVIENWEGNLLIPEEENTKRKLQKFPTDI
jgi:hypothetical protein